MKTVNIHEAKTHLSRLVDEAARGEPFIIAKSGKPIVRVTAIDSPVPSAMRRIGFLEGRIDVPDNFDEIGRKEIEQIFASKR